MTDLVAHCPTCGAILRGDEEACPRCHSSMHGELLPLQMGASDAASSEDRPRRAGVPWAWIGGAVGAVVIAAAVIASIHHPQTRSTPTALPTFVTGPARPAIPPIDVRPTVTAVSGPTTTLPLLPGATTGLKLFLLEPGSAQSNVTILDLDGNRVLTAPLPGANPPQFHNYLSPQAFGPDNFIVEGTNGNVFIEPDTLVGPVIDLGPGSSYLLVPGSPYRAWIVDTCQVLPCSSRDQPQVPTVREVDPTGHTLVGPTPLPLDWSPFAATADGLVLMRGQQQQQFEVWDPVTRHVRFTGAPGAGPVDTSAHVVVWSYGCGDPFCPFHLTNLLTGRDSIVRTLLGSGGYGRSLISPDAAHIATFDTSAPDQRTRLVLTDVATGNSASLDLGAASFNGPFTSAWSLSGQWFFVGSSADLVLFHVGDPNFRHLNVPKGLLIGASLSAS